MRNETRTTIGIALLGIAGVLLLNTAHAVEWVEPTAVPPSANPPGFVWMRAPSDPAQPGGQFNVAGSGKVGGALDVIGKVIAGELCLGAECRQSWAEVAPASVLLQSATPGTAQAGNVNITGTAIVGNLTAAGCVGPVAVGVTAARNGSLGGYTGANAVCGAAFSGSRLCSVEDALESISCGAFGRSGVAAGTRFWVSGGPPGFTAAANDCRGWTSAGSDQLGRIWEYDVNGGKGFLSSCDVTYALGCCR